MSKAPAYYRQIKPLKEARGGVFSLRPETAAADKQRHQDGDYGDGEQRREGDRKCLGVSQRAEHPALLRFEQEYRQVMERIGYLEDLLAHPAKILALVKADLLALKDKYGDERRTAIVSAETQELPAFPGSACSPTRPR